MNALPINLLMLAQATPQETDEWTSVFWGLHGDQRFTLIIIALGCSIGLLLGTFGIVSGTLNSMHRRRVESDMKRDMIERGMSADEIAKVIESAAPPEDATQRWIASWACKKK